MKFTPPFSIFLSLLVFQLFSSSSFAQIDKDNIVSAYQSRYVFATNVNLRSMPSLNGEIVGKVNEGDVVQIMKTLKREIIGNLEGFWVKVHFNGKIAYMWDGLLARWGEKAGTNPDYLFLVGKGSTGEMTRMKIFFQGNKVDDFEFKGVRTYSGMYSGKLTGPKGVHGVKEFIFLEYSAEACGEINGSTIFAFDGKKVHRFFDDHGMGDSGFFESYHMVFPSDPIGKTGELHVFDQAGETIYDEEGKEGETEFSKNIHKVFKWTGNKLIQIK
ncbi:MAG: SH3 domain-containing protein [Bacteroidota bacterium]